MFTDWFFCTGKSHFVCEDYALEGDKFVIVSDGCSSAQHTDIGSRLLAHSAKLALSTAKVKDWPYYEFGQEVITKAAKILEPLKIQRGCLFATLIIAKVMPTGAINVKIYGDGIVIALSDDETMVIEVAFSNNMPYYLAYALDKHDMGDYKKYNNVATITRTINGVSDQQEVLPGNEVVYNFDPTKWHTVLIASDGLSQFVNSQTRGFIPLASIVQQVVDFKLMGGPFVKRRMCRMMEDLPAQKIVPLDDISVAGIHLEEGDRQWLNVLTPEENG